MTLGLVVGALAFGPLVGAAAAQDVPPEVDPATPEEVLEALRFYADEIFGQDLDGDGSPDVVDSDGDGIPDLAGDDEEDPDDGDPDATPGEDVPEEPDLQPADPLFLSSIVDDLEAAGVDLTAPEADGATLQGDCGGVAMSFDADGQLIDLAIGIPSNEGGGPDGQLIDGYGDHFGERAFTSSNPFIVDDRILYLGTLPRSGEGVVEYDWSVDIVGIPIGSGGNANEDGTNRHVGEVDLGSLPSVLKPAGIFPITAELSSENGHSCRGEGWVKFEGGNPLLTVPSAVAAVLGGFGLIGLLANNRPEITWKERP